MYELFRSHFVSNAIFMTKVTNIECNLSAIETPLAASIKHVRCQSAAGNAALILLKVPNNTIESAYQADYMVVARYF